ncbi:hypothetical protein SAMN04487866_101494 [Thermoactinomyces sp. DSM 45891]|uniref:hypothetical protein n=1 Tax=Thermoactinomyces sp. DSM 45891 TaxID=1761907 RepID=UPI000921C0A4|nr:hypothetical protein [Thermoactinomyces sp. DSM 45891]SFX09239.1 hypothetical protein SAMN04487866_101494 [Thermoactinomyces sp. DSM 45891]
MKGKRFVAGIITCSAFIIGTGFVAPTTTVAAGFEKNIQGGWEDASFQVENISTLPQEVTSQVDVTSKAITMVNHDKKTYVYLSLGTQGALYHFNVNSAVITKGKLFITAQAKMAAYKYVASPEYEVISFDNSKYKINEVDGHIHVINKLN